MGFLSRIALGSEGGKLLSLVNLHQFGDPPIEYGPPKAEPRRTSYFNAFDYSLRRDQLGRPTVIAGVRWTTVKGP
jgi:hypothetical protein